MNKADTTTDFRTCFMISSQIFLFHVLLSVKDPSKINIMINKFLEKQEDRFLIMISCPLKYTSCCSSSLKYSLVVVQMSEVYFQMWFPTPKLLTQIRVMPQERIPGYPVIIFNQKQVDSCYQIKAFSCSS